jgi:hypothetical protein
MELRRALLAVTPLACASLALAACADQAVTAPAPAAPPANASLISAAQSAAWPDVIALQTGFGPEGIEAGRGTTLYVGSIPSGTIVRVDARTGALDTLVQPQPGRQASGIEFDQRTDRLFVAGGLTGQLFVYDATTGANVASYAAFTPFTGLMNDAVLTQDAVYFTDSFNPVLYKLPLGPGGSLPAAGAVQTIPLTGDYVTIPGQLNGNGIVATPDGKTLVMVNSTSGQLYRVDPATGVATTIPVAGGPLVAGDGLLLYVVQGAFQRIAVVRLSADHASGAVERTITSGAFGFPATIDEIGGSLYAVNAHFDITPPPPAPAPGVEFEVVRVSKK